jgi:hypothetical protein
MFWKHAKIAVMAPPAVLSGQAARQKSREKFPGLILSRPVGAKRTIRPFYFYKPFRAV